MKAKDFRTIDYYMKPGAEIRLLKTICLLLLEDTKLCPKTFVGSKICKLYSFIQQTGDAIEHQMHVDAWQLTDERHLAMFEGALTNEEARNNIDKDIKKLAKEIIKSIEEKIGE